ncbi:MAG TPA: hypothetical protein V6D03_15575, partial [Candidatus Caenarcaniphilales bacterium]
NRVLQRLEQLVEPAGNPANAEGYPITLVREQLNRLEADIDQLQNQYPQIQKLASQQLQAELLAIEADTYAEFIRDGRLNNQLSPLLLEVLPAED